MKDLKGAKGAKDEEDLVAKILNTLRMGLFQLR